MGGERLQAAQGARRGFITALLPALGRRRPLLTSQAPLPPPHLFPRLVLGPQCEGPAPPASLYDWDMAAAANAAAAFKAKQSDSGLEEQQWAARLRLPLLPPPPGLPWARLRATPAAALRRPLLCC